MFVMNDAEAGNFAEKVRNTFHDAGIRVDWVGGVSRGVPSWGRDVFPFGIDWLGFTVWEASPVTPQSDSQKILAAFAKAGIKAKMYSGEMPDDWKIPDHAVAFFVGTRVPAFMQMEQRKK